MNIPTRWSFVLSLSAAIYLAGGLAHGQDTKGIDASCESGISVMFVESAPRDRFVFDNQTDTSIATISLDLEGSVGKLYFDTTDAGDGVEVFQPFRVEDSDASLATTPTPGDGDAQLELEFTNFAPAESFTFSIDIDDRLTDSNLGQIRVSGSEIAGARVQVTFASELDTSIRADSEFTEDARAYVCKD